MQFVQNTKQMKKEDATPLAGTTDGLHGESICNLQECGRALLFCNQHPSGFR
jgi:hypothetical protein